MIILKRALLFCIFFGCFLFTCQQVRAEDSFSQKLAQSLAGLKQNVDQLSVSNQSQGLKNEQMKVSLKDSQITLGKLMQENQQLEESKAKLQKPTSGKTQQIAQLKKTLGDLDNQIIALNQQLKISQDKIVNEQKQEVQLNQQMTQFNKPEQIESDVLSPEVSQLIEKKQKEKLAMLKMISESQSRQELLQQKILDYKKNIPIPNVLVKDMENKKEMLEASITQLRDEIVQLNYLANNDSKHGWSEEQIHQLELSVNNLEENRDELRGLIQKIQQKAKQGVPTQEEIKERVKLQSNISKLKEENRNLKIDFAQLQQQMVDLDKRKSYMESFLQK